MSVLKLAQGVYDTGPQGRELRTAMPFARERNICRTREREEERHVRMHKEAPGFRPGLRDGSTKALSSKCPRHHDNKLKM